MSDRDVNIKQHFEANVQVQNISSHSLSQSASLSWGFFDLQLSSISQRLGGLSYSRRLRPAVSGPRTSVSLTETSPASDAAGGPFFPRCSTAIDGPRRWREHSRPSQPTVAPQCALKEPCEVQMVYSNSAFMMFCDLLHHIQLQKGFCSSLVIKEPGVTPYLLVVATNADSM